MRRNLLLFSMALFLCTACDKDKDEEQSTPTAVIVGFDSTEALSDEKAGEKHATIRLNRTSNTDLTLQILVSGTAVEGEDFRLLIDNSVNIPAGELTALVKYTLIADDQFEANAETIVLKLVSATETAVVESAKSTFTHTIEADGTSMVSFAVESSQSGETDEEMHSMIELSKVFNKDVVVKFAVSGTATLDSDFVLKTASPLIILAGETTAQIKYTVKSDDMFESADETIIFTLISETEGTAVESSKAIFTHVIVAEVPSIVSFKTTSAESGEQEGERTAIIQLDKPLKNEATLDFEVSGTAINGSDFIVHTKGPITIPAGETTAALIYEVLADDEHETSMETVIFKLSNPKNGLSLSSVQSEITFTHAVAADPERDPVLVSFGNSTIDHIFNENSFNLGIKIELDRSVDYDVVIQMEVFGSAGIGEDFNFDPGFVVTIPAGESFAVIDLQIIEDTMIEEDEDIVFKLHEVSSGAKIDLDNSEIRYQIIDNDESSAVNEAGMMIDITWNTGSDSNIDMILMRESGGISTSAGFGSEPGFEQFFFSNSRSDGDYYINLEHVSGEKDLSFSVVTTTPDGKKLYFYGTYRTSQSDYKYDFIKITKSGNVFEISQ